MFWTQELDAKCTYTFDPALGTVAIAILDAAGQIIDGSNGIDALGGRFAHEGRQVRLPAELRNILTLVAAHGGRWVPGRGFTVREEDAADALRALRTLPERRCGPSDEPTSLVGVDARPLVTTQYAELEGREQLRCTTAFAAPDRSESLSVEHVISQAKVRTWVRTRGGFARRPRMTPAELDETATRVARPLVGDDVPFFLAKQLTKADPNVTLGPRAARARVHEGKWLPEVHVDVEGARLRLGFSFRTEGVSFPRSAAQATDARRYLPLPNDTWARNDAAARRRVDEAIKARPWLERQSDDVFEAPAYTLPDVADAFADVAHVDLAASAEALLAKLRSFERIETVPVPASLRATLRPYQREGLNWLAFLRKYGLRGILADDMGLGKTVQTLAALLLAHEAGETDACLVVCPASVVAVWDAEVRQWCGGLTPVVLTAQNRERYLAGPPMRTLAITSYAAVARAPEVFQRPVWNYVVLDEAHKIKNPQTASAKACQALRSRHKLAITGTPVQNRLRDLWAIYEALMPGYLGSSGEFQRRFEVPITGGDEPAAARLRTRIDPFKLRRTKTQVASDLPALTQQVLSIGLTPLQQQLYDDLLNEVPDLLRQLRDPEKRSSPMLVLERLLRLRQVCAHPKLVRDQVGLYDEASGKFELLREQLEAAFEEGHKVLIFSQWTQMAHLICKHLSNEKVAYAYLDGTLSQSKRASVVRAFQEPSGPPALVVSLLAGGEGITLTQADTVFLFDRWWNPAVEDQAIARAHRIGQSRPVTAYILEAKGTIEERLADLIRRKKDLAGTIVTVDAATKSITRDELISLLEDELTAARQRGQVARPGRG